VQGSVRAHPRHVQALLHRVRHGHPATDAVVALTATEVSSRAARISYPATPNSWPFLSSSRCAASSHYIKVSAPTGKAVVTWKRSFFATRGSDLSPARRSGRHKSGFKVCSPAPSGTTIAYRLAQISKVRFTIRLVTLGRKVANTHIVTLIFASQDVVPVESCGGSGSVRAVVAYARPPYTGSVRARPSTACRSAYSSRATGCHNSGEKHQCVPAT